MEDMLKRCKDCGRDLPRTEFYRDKSRGDGLMVYCKICSNTRARAWRRAHSEEHRALVKAWRLNNIERIRAHSRRWQAAHPVEFRESRRRYRQRKRMKAQQKEPQE
jgi:hypothetical protein